MPTIMLLLHALPGTIKFTQLHFLRAPPSTSLNFEATLDGIISTTTAAISEIYQIS